MEARCRGSPSLHAPPAAPPASADGRDGCVESISRSIRRKCCIRRTINAYIDADLMVTVGDRVVVVAKQKAFTIRPQATGCGCLLKGTLPGMH